jgi:hypothetical protein
LAILVHLWSSGKTMANAGVGAGTVGPPKGVGVAEGRGVRVGELVRVGVGVRVKVAVGLGDTVRVGLGVTVGVGIVYTTARRGCNSASPLYSCE